MAVRKIVIPLEITPISAEVLPVVRHLFAPEQVELTLVAVAQRPEMPIVSDVHLTGLPPTVYTARLATDEEWDAYCRELKDKLNATAQQLRAAGYRVVVALRTGEKIYELARFVENGRFDLLAMATYGRKGLSRLVYGSVAEQLLRLVSVPMLLARYQASAAGKPVMDLQPASSLAHEPPLLIAVATEDAPHPQPAVVFARILAHALQARLQVLVTAGGRAGAAPSQQVMRQVQSLFEQVAVQPEFIPLAGSTDEVVSQHLAQSSANLLVVGALQDRPTGDAAEIGITAHRVVQNAPMSVLVLKGEQTAVTRMLVCVGMDVFPLMEVAFPMARALGATLQLLHSVPAPTDAPPKMLTPGDPVLDALLSQDAQLAQLLQETRSKLQEFDLAPESLQVWQGDALTTILQAAQAGNYDLLVIGSHIDARSFPGSLADSLVRLAPASVLVVRN
jgi:nucleotide-binding universal stress UspA family protein